MFTPEAFFTPEELARIIAGECITKSEKDNSVKSANKNAEETPVPNKNSFTPKHHVPIRRNQVVTKPNLLHEGSEKIRTISPGRIAKVSQDEVDRQKKREMIRKARAESQKQADPINLMNQLNGLRRIVEKQDKLIQKLEKKLNTINKNGTNDV